MAITKLNILKAPNYIYVGESATLSVETDADSFTVSTFPVGVIEYSSTSSLLTALKFGNAQIIVTAKRDGYEANTVTLTIRTFEHTAKNTSIMFHNRKTNRVSRLMGQSLTDTNIVIKLPRTESGTLALLGEDEEEYIPSTQPDDTGSGIRKPYIIDPKTGDVDREGQITVSPYETYGDFTGAHEGSVFEYATDMAFTNILDKRTIIRGDKTKGPIFHTGATIWVKVKYVSGDVESEWSDPVQFACGNYGRDSLQIIPNNGDWINGLYFGIVPHSELIDNREYRGHWDTLNTYGLNEFKAGMQVHQASNDTLYYALTDIAAADNIDPITSVLNNDGKWAVDTRENLPTPKWVNEVTGIGMGYDDASSDGYSVGATSIGTIIDHELGWIKYVYKGMLCYTPVKPICTQVCWNDIGKRDIIYGERTFRGGATQMYRIRLMRDDEYVAIIGGLMDGTLANMSKVELGLLNFNDNSIGRLQWIEDFQEGPLRKVGSPDIKIFQVDPKDRVTSLELDGIYYKWELCYRPVIELVTESDEPWKNWPLGPTMENEVFQYDKYTDTGYFGQVTPDKFVSGPNLAVMIGMTGGYDINISSGWFKFWWHGIMLYSSIMPFRGYFNMTFTKINGTVLPFDTGDSLSQNYTINDINYRCSLPMILQYSPHDMITSGVEIGHYSQYNELWYRVYKQSGHSEYINSMNGGYDYQGITGPLGYQIGDNWDTVNFIHIGGENYSRDNKFDTRALAMGNWMFATNNGVFHGWEVYNVDQATYNTDDYWWPTLYNRIQEYQYLQGNKYDPNFIKGGNVPVSDPNAFLFNNIDFLGIYYIENYSHGLTYIKDSCSFLARENAKYRITVRVTVGSDSYATATDLGVNVNCPPDEIAIVKNFYGSISNYEQIYDYAKDYVICTLQRTVEIGTDGLSTYKYVSSASKFTSGEKLVAVSDDNKGFLDNNYGWSNSTIDINSKFSSIVLDINDDNNTAPANYTTNIGVSDKRYKCVNFEYTTEIDSSVQDGIISPSYIIACLYIHNDPYSPVSITKTYTIPPGFLKKSGLTYTLYINTLDGRQNSENEYTLSYASNNSTINVASYFEEVYSDIGGDAIESIGLYRIANDTTKTVYSKDSFTFTVPDGSTTTTINVRYMLATNTNFDVVISTEYYNGTTDTDANMRILSYAASTDTTSQESAYSGNEKLLPRSKTQRILDDTLGWDNINVSENLSTFEPMLNMATTSHSYLQRTATITSETPDGQILPATCIKDYNMDLTTIKAVYPAINLTKYGNTYTISFPTNYANDGAAVNDTAYTSAYSSVDNVTGYAAIVSVKSNSNTFNQPIYRISNYYLETTYSKDIFTFTDLGANSEYIVNFFYCYTEPILAAVFGDEYIDPVVVNYFSGDYNDGMYTMDEYTTPTGPNLILSTYMRDMYTIPTLTKGQAYLDNPSVYIYSRDEYSYLSFFNYEFIDVSSPETNYKYNNGKFNLSNFENKISTKLGGMLSGIHIFYKGAIINNTTKNGVLAQPIRFESRYRDVDLSNPDRYNNVGPGIHPNETTTHVFPGVYFKRNGNNITLHFLEDANGGIGKLSKDEYTTSYLNHDYRTKAIIVTIKRK